MDIWEIFKKLSVINARKNLQGEAADVAGRGRQGLCNPGPDPVLSALCIQVHFIITNKMPGTPPPSSSISPTLSPLHPQGALLLGGMHSPPLGLDTTCSLCLDCSPLRYPSAHLPHLLSETHLTDRRFNPATCSLYLPILLLLPHTKYYLLMYHVIYIFIVLLLLEGP